MPKSRYLRMDRKAFVKQLAKIERRQKHLSRIKQRMACRFNPLEKVSKSPEVHHHIGMSQDRHSHIGTFLQAHVEDPAIKVVDLFH